MPGVICPLRLVAFQSQPSPYFSVISNNKGSTLARPRHDLVCIALSCDYPRYMVGFQMCQHFHTTWHCVPNIFSLTATSLVCSAVIGLSSKLPVLFPRLEVKWERLCCGKGREEPCREPPSLKSLARLPCSRGLGPSWAVSAPTSSFSSRRSHLTVVKADI